MGEEGKEEGNMPGGDMPHEALLCSHGDAAEATGDGMVPAA